MDSYLQITKSFHQDVIMDPNIWSTLPPILLDLIFARMPLKSLIQLRLLSKHWHSYLTSPTFQFAFRDGPPKSFAFVDNMKWVWAYDVTARRWDGIPLQYLPFSYLVAADGGLLCFVKYSLTRRCLQVAVCNPLTCRWRELPPVTGLDLMPRKYHMKVDTNSKQYTIKCFDDKCFVYSSETNAWNTLQRSREVEVVRRYILVNVHHGMLHIYNTQPGASRSIPFPPDLDQDITAGEEGSYLVQGEAGNLFLLKDHESNSNGEWGQGQISKQKWEEFCRIPRVNDLQSYFFCVFLCGDFLFLLGRKKSLFYNVVEEKESDDSDGALERANRNLMLMVEMNTKTWTDVTNHYLDPGVCQGSSSSCDWMQSLEMLDMAENGKHYQYTFWNCSRLNSTSRKATFARENSNSVPKFVRCKYSFKFEIL